MAVTIVALVLAWLLASLSPGKQFLVHLVIFFIFTLPLCIILWKLEAFALFYYAINMIGGAIFTLLGLFYSAAYGG